MVIDGEDAERVPGGGWGWQRMWPEGNVILLDEAILNDWGEGMAGSPRILHTFIYLFFLPFFILNICPIPQVAVVFTQLSV